jgi:hypothetical protein
VIILLIISIILSIIISVARPLKFINCGAVRGELHFLITSWTDWCPLYEPFATKPIDYTIMGGNTWQ